MSSGTVTRGDVDAAIQRGFVRPDILLGNNGRDSWADRSRRLVRRLRLSTRDLIRRTAYATGWAQ